MQISAFSPGCGVEMNAVQLAFMTDAQLETLRGALTEHGLVFFRGQQLSEEEHLRFARRFGDIVVNNFFKPLAGYP